MIATWWPEGETRNRYQVAAVRFRIPYWDWAAAPPSGQSVLPLSVGGSPYIDIDGPNGLQRISNPLFSYTFKPLNATAFTQPPVSMTRLLLKLHIKTMLTERGPSVEHLELHPQKPDNKRRQGTIQQLAGGEKF